MEADSPRLTGVAALSGEPFAYADGSLCFLVCEAHLDFLVLHWLYVQNAQMEFHQLSAAIRGRFGHFLFQDSDGELHTYKSSQRTPGAAGTSLIGSVIVRPGVATLPAWIRVTVGSTSARYDVRPAWGTPS